MSTTPNMIQLVVEIIDWIHRDRADEGLGSIDVTAQTQLLEEGVFDSMKILEFVNWLETTYGINIGVEELTPKFFASPQTVATEVLKLQADTSRQGS